jgi:hypothetical protein
MIELVQIPGKRGSIATILHLLTMAEKKNFMGRICNIA